MKNVYFNLIFCVSRISILVFLIVVVLVIWFDPENKLRNLSSMSAEKNSLKRSTFCLLLVGVTEHLDRVPRHRQS